MASRSVTPILLSVTLLFTACRRAEVTAYRVPKEKDQALVATRDRYERCSRSGKGSIFLERPAGDRPFAQAFGRAQPAA